MANLHVGPLPAIPSAVPTAPVNGGFGDLLMAIGGGLTQGYAQRPFVQTQLSEQQLGLQNTLTQMQNQRIQALSQMLQYVPPDQQGPLIQQIQQILQQVGQGVGGLFGQAPQGNMTPYGVGTTPMLPPTGGGVPSAPALSAAAPPTSAGTGEAPATPPPTETTDPYLLPTWADFVQAELGVNWNKLSIFQQRQVQAQLGITPAQFLTAHEQALTRGQSGRQAMDAERQTLLSDIASGKLSGPAATAAVQAYNQRAQTGGGQGITEQDLGAYTQSFMTSPTQIDTRLKALEAAYEKAKAEGPQSVWAAAKAINDYLHTLPPEVMAQFQGRSKTQAQVQQDVAAVNQSFAAQKLAEQKARDQAMLAHYRTLDQHYRVLEQQGEERIAASWARVATSRAKAGANEKFAVKIGGKTYTSPAAIAEARKAGLITDAQIAKAFPDYQPPVDTVSPDQKVILQQARSLIAKEAAGQTLTPKERQVVDAATQIMLKLTDPLGIRDNAQ